MIKFVSNYDDRSTERGFQFEFYCDRCGSGYRTRFQASATGLVTEVLDVAGGLLGGLMGSVADAGERMHLVVWERVYDKVFEVVVEEVMSYFK